MRALTQMAEEGIGTDPVALALSADTSYAAWKRIGRQLGFVERGSRWWIGDWIIFAETAFRGRVDLAALYEQAEALTGLSHGTMLNIRSVCANIPPQRRHPKLSFSIHFAVIPLSPRDQVKWLARAYENGWTRTQLRRAIKGGDAPLAILPQERRLEVLAIQLCERAAKTEEGYVVGSEEIERLAQALGMLDLLERKETIEQPLWRRLRLAGLPRTAAHV